MSRLVIHAQAETELDEAIGWYEEQRAGLGLHLLNDVDAALAETQANPDRGAKLDQSRFRF